MLDLAKTTVLPIMGQFVANIHYKGRRTGKVRGGQGPRRAPNVLSHGRRTWYHLHTDNDRAKHSVGEVNASASVSSTSGASSLLLETTAEGSRRAAGRNEKRSTRCSDVMTTDPTRGRLTALCSAPAGALKTQVSRLRDQRRGRSPSRDALGTAWSPLWEPTKKSQAARQLSNSSDDERWKIPGQVLKGRAGARSLQSQRGG